MLLVALALQTRHLRPGKLDGEEGLGSTVLDTCQEGGRFPDNDVMCAGKGCPAGHRGPGLSPQLCSVLPAVWPAHTQQLPCPRSWKGNVLWTHRPVSGAGPTASPRAGRGAYCPPRGPCCQEGLTALAVGGRLLHIQTQSLSASCWPGFSKACAQTRAPGTEVKTSTTVALELPTRNVPE